MRNRTGLMIGREVRQVNEVRGVAGASTRQELNPITLMDVNCREEDCSGLEDRSGLAAQSGH